MEKAWFMVPMEYSPNGKVIMAPREYTPMVYSPKLKTWFYERLFFEVVIIMVRANSRNLG